MDEKLYDHYKDTFEQQKAYIQKRDKYTRNLLICIFFFVCILMDPQKLTEYVNAYFKKSVCDIPFDFAILNSFLLYVVLWVILQYYQTCLTIEKGYDYLSDLESKLNLEREGVSYSSNYPILKNVANFIYAWGIPIGIIALCIVKFIKELDLSGCNIVIDSVALLLIVLLSIFYFSDRNLKWDFFNSKKHKGIGFWNRVKGFVKLDIDEVASEQ